MYGPQGHFPRHSFYICENSEHDAGKVVACWENAATRALWEEGGSGLRMLTHGAAHTSRATRPHAVHGRTDPCNLPENSLMKGEQISISNLLTFMRQKQLQW